MHSPIGNTLLSIRGVSDYDHLDARILSDAGIDRFGNRVDQSILRDDNSFMRSVAERAGRFFATVAVGALLMPR